MTGMNDSCEIEAAQTGRLENLFVALHTAMYSLAAMVAETVPIQHRSGEQSRVRREKISECIETENWIGNGEVQKDKPNRNRENNCSRT